MNERLLKIIVSVLIVVSFIMPQTILTGEDSKSGRGCSNSCSSFIWREAESWDDSYNTLFGADWDIVENNTASDGYYTKPENEWNNGDWAKWNFMVYNSGNYHFWIRGWHNDSACDEIALYWNDNKIGEKDWSVGDLESWNWSYFGNKTLSYGDGVLRIESEAGILESNLIEVDNILITNNETYVPREKEVEGSTIHKIDRTLNFQFIKEVTENLSKVISEVDWGDGIPKGRAYGSKGEEYAKDNIIKPHMINLGLYDLGISYEEQINTTIDEQKFDKIDILSRGILINGTENISSECFISPRWNKSHNIFRLIFGLSSNYNFSELTYKFDHNNIEIKRVNETRYNFYNIINESIANEMMNNESIMNLSTMIDFLATLIEDEYDCIIEELDQITIPDNFSWIPPAGSFGPHVLIEEDPSFNPNATIGFISKSILNLFPPYSIIAKLALYGLDLFMEYLYTLTHPNYLGLIRYDFNKDEETYNIEHRKYMPRPTLYINHSIGNKMYENPDIYTINFWINQSYNNSVESYNIIGQINGTDPNKTIIVSSLYDSWWNQGTADSAIGMSIVLAIAKYFKENNFTPKYNLKFIAFGGEEYGFLGAESYEVQNRDENIVTIIDLNQLGFTQLDPRLTLNIMTNNNPTNSTIQKIAARTNYVNRTGNTTDFTTRVLDAGAPSNDRPFAISRILHPLKRGSCNTICFLKDKGSNHSKRWKLHHRDGQNHTEGDVMKYYDLTDIYVTIEMILNVTTYITGNSHYDQVYTGWNQITIPVDNNWNASDLGANITDCLQVSYWNNTMGQYQSWLVGISDPEDDYPILPGRGYFVGMYINSSLFALGQPVLNVSIPTGQGWNMIGWYNETSIMASNLADNITGCLQVSYWNNTMGQYQSWLVGISDPEDDYALHRGMGFFVSIDTGRGSSPDFPHPIYGKAFYEESNIHANEANVTVTNTNTSEKLYTEVGENAKYIVELANLPSGYSYGNIINVTINSTDTDIYKNWTRSEEIIVNDSAINQQVDDMYLCKEDSKVIRDDNGTMENEVFLDDKLDEVKKYLTLCDYHLEGASNAKLWIYGKESGNFKAGSSHRITVNDNKSCTINFNSIDKFDSEFGWQSFNISLNWLTAGSNNFSVIDAYSKSNDNNLLIGIDTENDYNRSQWKENSKDPMPPTGNCTGELMMVLEFKY